jgi:AraC-like DNA-binding protein
MGDARFELAPFSWYGSQRLTASRDSRARLFWIHCGCGTLDSFRQSEPVRPFSLIGLGPADVLVETQERIAGVSLEMPFDMMPGLFPPPVFPSLLEFCEELRSALVCIHFGQRARCEADWLLQRMLHDESAAPEFFWTSMRLTLGQFVFLAFQQWLLQEKDKERVSAGAESVVRSLREYIDGHLNEDFGLKRLSERAGYAPSYLSSLFSKVNGQGLTEYISRKRIEHAQQLLRTGNLKIVEICYRVGFRDLAHFNRTFKRFAGVTPNRYRHSGARVVLHVESPPPAVPGPRRALAAGIPA